MAVLIRQEEERRVFPGYEDALALSVVPPPPPGPPSMQPLCTPPARPRLEAMVEPWDPWPGSAHAWPESTPLVILGWAPGTPAPPPGPPPPPMVGRSSTSPAMTTTSRPCRRLHNQELGFYLFIFFHFILICKIYY
jgi:hypothetical protein